MAAGLAPAALRGEPIVGCEPSCLLTLREEHLSLLPGDPRAWHPVELVRAALAA